MKSFNLLLGLLLLAGVLLPAGAQARMAVGEGAPAAQLRAALIGDAAQPPSEPSAPQPVAPPAPDARPISNTGLLILGVVAGTLVLVGLIGLIVLVRRRLRR